MYYYCYLTVVPVKKFSTPTCSLAEVEAMLQFAAGGMQGELKVQKQAEHKQKPAKPPVLTKPDLKRVAMVRS